MSIASVVSKIVGAPVRIVDLPFRVLRELVDDPEPERGVFANIAAAVEEAVKETLEGK